VKKLRVIKTHPELNRLALKQQNDSAYLLWAILSESVRLNGLSSHYTKQSIRIESMNFGLTWTRRHLNRVLADGNGLFWTIGTKKVYLRSFKKVYSKMADHEALLIPSAHFVQINVEKSALNRRAELYWSWLYSRGEQTIARDTLQELFNLSHDQQRAYEKHLGSRLVIKSNYCHIDADLYSEQLQNIPTYAYSFIQEKFHNNTVEMVNVIAYQMPNTYIARKTGSSASLLCFAPNRALRVTRRLYRLASAGSNYERCYYNFYDEWEKNMSASAYIRTYYQGKKRIWRQGHFF